ETGNFLAIRDGSAAGNRFRLRRPANGTARNLRVGLGYFLAGQDLVDRLHQVLAGGLGPLHALGELVVDPTAVAHCQTAVQDEGFRGAFGVESVGDRGTVVLQDGER